MYEIVYRLKEIHLKEAEVRRAGSKMISESRCSPGESSYLSSACGTHVVERENGHPKVTLEVRLKRKYQESCWPKRGLPKGRISLWS